MGKLFAAAAVRDITPDEETLSIINTEGRYHYEGVKRKLFLRTVILTDGTERFVYFGTDLSNFTVNEEFQDILRSELGLEPKDYMFGTNRSHNTIGSWGANLHDEKRPGTSRFAAAVIAAMVESVKEAMGKLEPARIGAALGRSSINCFREAYTPAGNFEGMYHGAPEAPWLRVVRVERPNGETIALIVNYCMQNCMVSWNTVIGEYNYITSDLAGAIEEYLEKAGQNKYPVIWSNGGGADRQPLIYSNMDHCEVNDDGEFEYVHEVLPIDGILMLMRHFAAEQGLDVIRTMNSISNYSDEFNYFSDVEYTDVPGKVSLFKRIHMYKPGAEDVHPEPAAPVRFRYQMAVINGIAFCGVNAPVYSGVYEKLIGMMPFDVVVFMDDNFGGNGMASIPMPENEEEDRYVHATLQSRSYTARIGFNAFMAGFGKILEKYMLKAVYTYGNAPYPEKIED